MLEGGRHARWVGQCSAAPSPTAHALGLASPQYVAGWGLPTGACALGGKTGVLHRGALKCRACGRLVESSLLQRSAQGDSPTLLRIPPSCRMAIGRAARPWGRSFPIAGGLVPTRILGVSSASVVVPQAVQSRASLPHGRPAEDTFINRGVWSFPAKGPGLLTWGCARSAGVWVGRKGLRACWAPHGGVARWA